MGKKLTILKKFIIQRPKGKFSNNYPYKIFVEDKKLTELKAGEKKIIEIPNSLKNKELIAKIGWCGSNKLNLDYINEKEILKITENTFFHKKSIFIIALLPLTGVLMFGYGRDNEMVRYIGIGLFVLILLYGILIFTVGKNKWLKIKKIFYNN